ncbi:cytokine receptor family member B16 [Osmerus mordax]|uniref:cytokine receptor family member B16 n=1 Tax=Osmerus mordax TaxID=8014 RepID=UPI00350ED4C2
MVRRRSFLKSVLLLVLNILTKCVWLLPSPRDVTMKSINMRHVLKWRPPQSICSTTMYNVQFQGEFELSFLNGSWEDVPECQKITQNECDLTFDLSSDSDYNVRVRAECNNRVSPWSELHKPFNRRDTVLTVPDMTVTAMGHSLMVTFQNLSLTGGVIVTEWKTGEELRTKTHVIPVDQNYLHITSLQEGAEYCVKAYTHLASHSRSSSSTDTQCATITGHTAPWLKPTTAIAAVILVCLLFALFGSVVHCNPEDCQAYFHKEPMPASLRMDLSITISKLQLPKEELSESIHSFLLIDRHT